MLQMAEKPFMRNTNASTAAFRQGPRKSRFPPPDGPPWLIILNHLRLSIEGAPLIFRCIMRSIPALLACAFIFTAPASAETRVFIVANHADGYGVDQCLAKGEKCGAHAAASYCRSRDFAQASSYRRVDPDEITGSVPKEGANCPHGKCDDYVAITCQR
jgi:hypothetical protein